MTQAAAIAKHDRASHSWTLLAAPLAGFFALLLLIGGLVELSRLHVAASRELRAGLSELTRLATLRADLALVMRQARTYSADRSVEAQSHLAELATQADRDLAAVDELAGTDLDLRRVLNTLEPAVAERLSRLERLGSGAAPANEADADRRARDPQDDKSLSRMLVAVTAVEALVQRRLTEHDRSARGADSWLVAGLLACAVLAGACSIVHIFLQIARRRDQRYHTSLSQREELMRLLLDSAADMSIVMLDPAGCFASWPAAAQRMSGFAADDMIGRPFGAQFPGEPAAGDDLLREARDLGSVRVELERRRRDGTSFAAATSLTALFDDAGGLRGYAEVTRDVTERVRAERALRDSESRFRAMAEATPAILLETDAAGSLLYYNSTGDAYTGAGRHGLLGDLWLDVVHPDDRQSMLGSWRAAMSAGQPVEVECRLRRHDGQYRWFLCSAVPVRDPAGHILRWVAVVKDIDDRKRAEAVLARDRDELERLVAARTAELAESEAKQRETARRLRMLADYASDMVVRVGADGSLLYVSPAAERLYGAGEGSHYHSHVERLHPDDRAAVVESRARMQAGLVERETLTFRITSCKRETVWVESAGRLLRDPVTGQPDGYVAVLRDVTERRRLEESLRHAQKMEAIGRIAAGVAHDFNNLLQSVISGLELAIEEIGPGATGFEFIELALGSAQRGSSLTHHLLSYARKQMLHPRTLDLASFVLQMRRMLSRTLGPHIAVRCQVDADVPNVHVDPDQLQTAMLNLCINAADALQGGGELRLVVREPVAPGELVRLRVEDNGIGMDPATLAQACDPFFTTKGLDGTGLGLSMVQGFVEQSGGKLLIESQAGKGTVVELSFPADTAAAQLPLHPAALPQPSRRILVVDDEPELLVTAGAFLERAGLWVVRANSAAEALEELASGVPFDALVTDYAMPGMNGAELALAALSRRPGLPVLIITGYAEVRGPDALPDTVQVLHKPFMRNELLRALHQVMVRGGEQVGADTVLRGPGARW